MELSQQQALPVSQQDAWNALNDIELLKSCIPGCEAITPTGDNAYDLAITAAVGPVKARFKGKLHLADLNPPESYAMQFEVQGGAAGHGKGTAKVRLEPVSEAETLMHYDVNASIGGKLAQIGSRLVDMAARKMANDFFAAFTEALKARHAPPPAEGEATADAEPDAEAPGGLGARMKRLFGKG